MQDYSYGFCVNFVKIPWMYVFQLPYPLDMCFRLPYSLVLGYMFLDSFNKEGRSVVNMG